MGWKFNNLDECLWWGLMTLICVRNQWEIETENSVKVDNGPHVFDAAWTKSTQQIPLISIEKTFFLFLLMKNNFEKF